MFLELVCTFASFQPPNSPLDGNSTVQLLLVAEADIFMQKMNKEKLKKISSSLSPVPTPQNPKIKNPTQALIT